MRKTKEKKEKLKGPKPEEGDNALKIRNPYPLFLLAALSLALLYSILWVLGPVRQPYFEGTMSTSPPCQTGQTRSCVSGNCSGKAICVDGMWGGCRWDQVCSPGTSELCLSQSCPYGVRRCNECGTGFGPCGAT